MGKRFLVFYFLNLGKVLGGYYGNEDFMLLRFFFLVIGGFQVLEVGFVKVIEDCLVWGKVGIECDIRMIRVKGD